MPGKNDHAGADEGVDVRVATERGRAEGGMKTRLFYSVLVAGVFVLLTSAGFSEQRVRVAGSDLLGGQFRAALQKHGAEKGVLVETVFEGSRGALGAVIARTADAAVVMLAPDETPRDPGLVVEPVAYRIAVVVVPAHIGLTEISFAQLEGFFGAQGGAGHNVWRDLGVEGSAGPLAVSTHLWAEGSEVVSIDLFSHLVLRSSRLKTSVVRHETSQSLLTRLSSEEGGLAVLARMPPQGTGLRTLAVARAKGEPAFGPSADNIHTGDYPLRWPLVLVYRREDLERVRELRTFLAGDPARKILSAESGFVPVPASGASR